MTAEEFQLAVRRGRRASPFTGTVVVLMGAVRHTVTGCPVKSGDNKAKSEEWGLNHVRTLRVNVEKLKADGSATLPRMPETKDLLEYNGKTYNIVSVRGGDPWDSAWILEGTAPL